ncbi:unnamed protein product [Withania somnifera]
MARLIIDWNKILNDEPPAKLVVANKATPTGGDEQNDEISVLTDEQLTVKINRLKRLFGARGASLADKGEKLKASIKKYEDEFEKRKLLRSDKGTDGCVSLDRHRSGSIANGLGERSPQSAPALRLQSAFAVCFSNKLEDKASSKTTNGFQNELHALNRCDRKRTLTGQFSPKRRRKPALSLQEAPFKFPLSINKPGFYADGKRRDVSASSPRYSEKTFSSYFKKRWRSSQDHSACTLRHANDEDVVLVDEEEPDVDPRQQAHHVAESTRDAKIYYPSREDPESVEIYYSDMGSLAPEAYLSSTIMNFYIRYLQQTKSPTDGERCEYHFCNTYFYNKLKEAFCIKQNDSEASFVRLRRWWKGVNIFEKAYIFLPIHEKFLIEEWKFLRQEVVADLPIADKIWENLPDRIQKNIIPVPQQGNDYDCGLFVLFFMERFIAEVHERLKKKDLEMFGSKWFKPEEASRMRRIISGILEEKFKNSSDK